MLFRAFLATILLLGSPAFAATPPPDGCAKTVAGSYWKWVAGSAALVVGGALFAYLWPGKPATEIAPVPVLSPEVPTGPATWPIDAGTAPSALKKASSSVFRVGFLVDDPTKETVKTISWEAHDQRVAATPERPNAFLEAWLRAEGAHARALGLHRCPVVTTGIGSGFLVGDGTIFVTAMHNLDGTPFAESWNELTTAAKGLDRWKSKAASLAQKTPGLVLFDAKGEKIFDTRLPTDRATIAALPKVYLPTTFHREQPTEIEHLYGQVFSDFVAFRLNRKLGPGLTLAALDGTKPVLVGTVGFPGTGRRPYFQDGFHGYASIGNRIETKTVLDAMGNGVPAPEAVIKQTDLALFFSNMPKTQGMSGGPVLAMDGSVFSVLTRGYAAYGIHLSPRLMRDLLTAERIAEVEAAMKP